MSVTSEFFHPRSLIAKVFVISFIAFFMWAGHEGHLTPIRDFLSDERMTLTFMDYNISPYTILKGLLVILGFFWVSSLVSSQVEKRIATFTRMRVSNRELLSKAATLLIYFVFFVAALDMIGIDLKALTVLGGAVGIGIGFGLQKITSNFISGIILLAEKSVEVDDLIELGDGTQGFVRHTGARYSLVETFDGKEVMVPNEDFITARVVNWTLTSKHGRVEIQVGVAYGSDLELVRTLLLEAAKEHERCVPEPEPVCYLDGFGDSSINFTLHFWVADVTEGRRGPKSDVLFTIWHKFAANKIEIPFPQRDLHLKTVPADMLGKPANDGSGTGDKA
ncbi:mechanosensitive ion channel family protein [Kordiimonas gwangyangensis]|uniref:mechanosensitive ion channel family protein n=1 Tax=Kordiimonas gwangyangensis TaxID=288022 RepID=UPI000360A592|nr:mechanosensitive ion channel domain-containing protein [Kordiimonas gwangyangensis]